MEFRLLGPFEVWDGDQKVDIAGSKRRALLVLLVLRANEVVRSERLVDELWGERPPRNAAAALHNHVFRLRKALGSDTIARREWGYVLRAAPAETDLRRFEDLLVAGEPLPARERSGKLAEALALWRGPPLADLVDEPALQRDIARLEELRLSTLERRIDADLEAGRNADLAAELEGLIAEHPLREHLRWQLILALYRGGRQAEALEVYRETRRVLTEELGLEPSPELRELERAILQHDPALRVEPRPATAEPATGGRTGRRRRGMFIGATALALLIGAGAAAYALTSRSTHVADRALTPVKDVTRHNRPQLAHSRAAARPTEPASPITKHTIDAQNARPAILHGAATRPTAAPTTTAVTTTAGKATATKKPTTKAAKTPVSTTAPTETTTSGANPQPVRIADDFGDPTLDPLTWSIWSAGTGSSYAQTNGEAVFSIAGDVTFEPKFHQAGINIGTKCRFPGDFDARVDFSLLQWPTGNGATVSLVAYQTGLVDEVTRSTTTQYDIYTAWPNQGTAPLADTSGSFRIARSNGIVRTYFWHRDQWHELGKLSISGEIWVGVSIWTFANLWQQQPVSAAFDNFVITAPDANCPTGSDPRNP